MHDGVGKPSGSIIKLNLLFFRILVQVEVMASRVCGISINSFDFTLCPVWPSPASHVPAGTAPTLPEPPETFYSSTTSESCHGLHSV